MKARTLSTAGLFVAALTLVGGSCTMKGAFEGQSDSRGVQPPVGLIACDEFFYPNANFAFTYQNTRALLESCGFSVKILGSRELAEERVLNSTDIPVLLNIYGDAFPGEAAESLRRYHRGGGCLVSNGVPFGFVCKRVKNDWEGTFPPETNSPRLHSAIGTGGWSRIDRVERILYHPGADPIGLSDLALTQVPSGLLYGLDATSLPAEDVVHAIVTAEGDGGETVAVAVIEHHCREFPGAIDVWTGSHLYSEPLPEKIAIQEQLFVRACAYILEQRGRIDRKERQAIVARARERFRSIPLNEKPWPDPAGPLLPLEPIPRAGSAEQNILVVDIRNEDQATQRAILSLQGHLNREKPKVFVLATPEDEGWLEYVLSDHLPGATVEPVSPEEFFARFAAGGPPAVVYPAKEQLFCGVNVAIAYAAASNAIVASPDVVSRFGLEIAEDLRERDFRSSAEACQWVYESSWSKMDPGGAAAYSPEKHLMTDYLIAQRIFPFWVSGPRDAVEAGASVLGEMLFAERLLGGMPWNVPVFGFGHQGRYRGIGESEMVELVSRFGKYQPVTGRTPNLSFYTGIQVPALKQKRRECPSFDPSKVYVALHVSDGDNLNYWHSRFPKLWEDPAHGTFPVSWSLGPSGLDVESVLIARAYRDATENDHFVAGVSGFAYIYPEVYGIEYADPGPIFEGFLELTRRQMERLDMTCAHIHHHGPYGETSRGTLTRYAGALEGMKAEAGPTLLVAYGRRDYIRDYEASHFVVGEGVPVFYSLTQGRVGTVVDQLAAEVGDRRPAFVHAFIHPWRLKLGEFKERFDALGDDYVLVTTEELGELYRTSYLTD